MDNLSDLICGLRRLVRHRSTPQFPIDILQDPALPRTRMATARSPWQLYNDLNSNRNLARVAMVFRPHIRFDNNLI